MIVLRNRMNSCLRWVTQYGLMAVLLLSAALLFQCSQERSQTVMERPVPGYGDSMAAQPAVRDVTSYDAYQRSTSASASAPANATAATLTTPSIVIAEDQGDVAGTHYKSAKVTVTYSSGTEFVVWIVWVAEDSSDYPEFGKITLIQNEYQRNNMAWHVQFAFEDDSGEDYHRGWVYMVNDSASTGHEHATARVHSDHESVNPSAKSNRVKGSGDGTKLVLRTMSTAGGGEGDEDWAILLPYASDTSTMRVRNLPNTLSGTIGSHNYFIEATNTSMDVPTVINNTAAPEVKTFIENTVEDVVAGADVNGESIPWP